MPFRTRQRDLRVTKLDLVTKLAPAPRERTTRPLGRRRITVVSLIIVKRLQAGEWTTRIYFLRRHVQPPKSE